MHAGALSCAIQGRNKGCGADTVVNRETRATSGPKTHTQQVPFGEICQSSLSVGLMATRATLSSAWKATMCWESKLSPHKYWAHTLIYELYL